MNPTPTPAMSPGMESVRPKKWVRPSKRPKPTDAPLSIDPINDSGISPRASQVEARLFKEYCQPGDYCCWPDLERMAIEIDVPFSSLKRLLAELVKAGRVVRMPYRAFRSWIETTAEPVHGLTRPKRMRSKPHTVTIFLRRLPAPLRDPSLIWPLGLKPESEPSLGSDLSRGSAHFRDAPSYEHSEGTEERNETKTNFVSSHSPIGSQEEEKTMPVEAPPVAPGSLSPIATIGSTTDRENRSEAILDAPRGTTLTSTDRDDAIGLLAMTQTSFRNSGWWTLYDANALPPEWVGKPPAARPLPERPVKPQPPPLSQGKPRRNESVKTREADPAEKAIRDLAATSKTDEEASFAIEKAAQAIARSLNDLKAVGTYRQKMIALAFGEISVQVVLDAYRAARSPNGTPPGKIFHGQIKRGRA